MRRTWIVLLLLAPTAQAEIAIRHDSVGCMVAGKLPRLTSTFTPPDGVAQARVYFRAKGTPSWYWVPMSRDGNAYQGILPKPLKSTPGIEYYVEAVDTAAGTSRTQEYAADVVHDAGACSKKALVAVAVGAAKVAVGVPAGVSGLVPAGFAADGVVAATAAAGAAGGSGGAAGVGAGTAGAGGGIGTTALVVGGVAVAGAAAAVVVTQAGDDNYSGNAYCGYSNQCAYNLAWLPSPPGLTISACTGNPNPVGLSGQSITVDGQGNFNDTSSNVIRVAGRMTDTSLSATITCVNGNGPSGSMTGTGSSGTYTGSKGTGTGASYSGTFEFAGSRGNFQVTKYQ